MKFLYLERAEMHGEAQLHINLHWVRPGKRGSRLRLEAGR